MSEPERTQDLTSYHGNCHCGAVKFTAQIPSLIDHEVTCCNCSICTRNGYLLVYPKKDDFVLQDEQKNLRSYRFGSMVAEHMFCKTCGSSVVVKYNDDVAINVRLFHEIDIKELKLKNAEGKKTKPEYKPGEDFHWQDADVSDVSSTLIPYAANCHCGEVKYTIRIPSLLDHQFDGQDVDAYKVNSCNCSICTKNGYLLIYPLRENVTFHTGFDKLQSYQFASKKNPHKFCGNCGSSLYIEFNFAGTVKRGDSFTMNVRMLRDVQLNDYKYRYTDGKTLKPAYNVGY